MNAASRARWPNCSRNPIRLDRLAASAVSIACDVAAILLGTCLSIAPMLCSCRCWNESKRLFA